VILRCRLTRVEQREHAGIAPQCFRSLQEIELRRTFRMIQHVLPDRGRGADLFRLDVQALHLLGKTASFPRQGGTLAPRSAGAASIVMDDLDSI
jgi:hypothetical protein